MTVQKTSESVDRYPLAWPVGWPRTQAGNRRPARFHSRSEAGGLSRNKAMTLGIALDRLERELNFIAAQAAVLSTNLPLGIRGSPLHLPKPHFDDPGVAVYFRHKGKPIVLACDKWSTVADNVAAIAAHIDAIRRMDRYGVGRLEQALAGYTRLLSGRRAWFDVLDVQPHAPWEHIEAVYKQKAKERHPDRRGGSDEAMAELNEAYETAKMERLNGSVR